MGPKRKRGGADGVGAGSATRGRAKRVRRGGGAPPATPSVGGGTVCRSTPASGAATTRREEAAPACELLSPVPRMQALQISPRHSTATDAGLHAAGHAAGDDGGGPCEQVAEQVSAETPGRTDQETIKELLHLVETLHVTELDASSANGPTKPQMESVRQMLGGCAECLPAEALTKAGQPKKELSKSVLQRVLVTKMEQAGFAAELAQKRQDRHAGRRLQEWSPPGQQRAASPEASSTGEQVDASRRPFQRSARRGLAKTTARTAAADFQKCGFDQAQANVSVFSGDFFNNVQRSDAGAVKKFEAGVAFAQQRIGEKLSSTDTPPPSVAPAPRSVLAAGGMSPPPASPPTAGGISLRPTSPTRTYRGALVLKSWRRSGSIASTSASTPPKSTVLVLVP